MCPSCGAAERHRLQALVFRELCKQRAPGQLRCLHCGPEPWFRGRLASQVGHYVSSDPVISRVHLRADLRRLPFSAGAFDIVIASFIIQYIPEDAVALTEIRRVLAPGGVALLAVPIVAATTIEYPGANTFESGGHVRAPGLDYFERYKAVFSLVRVYESADFPDAHQLYVYEDRTNWPNEWMPLRKPMPGERHPEFLPVCFA
jgi:SAM-dependent methyltransferase